ncbi:MAG: FKBP-type peptidyl-prolyl cis-trans isomerase [Bacteroidales bacterium]|nr:FKBP-type peptidyl-prolyl cis-trans isomerase [Bacteroidales bacterium]
MLVKKLLYIIILAVSVVSCKSNNGEQTEIKDPYSKVKAEKQEETIQINKDMLDVNRDIVEKYIARHNWEMTETESGLLYMIYVKTNDTEVKSCDIVEFAFKTSLLNGDVLYDSDATGNRKMTIDRNQEESGLNEGLKLMKKGEKAYFILQPHLAFGVAGDSYKIPPYSVLVYDIEVVDIKSPENEFSDYGEVVL